jgi:hypothetical protein
MTIEENGKLVLINGDSIDFKDKFSEVSQLAAAQHLQIQILTAKIEEKQTEINHLKELLYRHVPEMNFNVIQVTDEEVIARSQLEKLKRKAMNNTLTLEEIKMFDLLVKNKRLAEGKSTVNTTHEKLAKETSPEELLLIASKVVKSE